MRGNDKTEQRRGLGPFSSAQLTLMVCVGAIAAVMIPTAAMAVAGSFTSTTATPAVSGLNSSAAAGAKGVYGQATAGGSSSVQGVAGTANISTNGVGVQGVGKKWGVSGSSSGTALNSAGLWGSAPGVSALDHFGVWGSAGGTGGIGVKGIGTKNGVVSQGPFLSTAAATFNGTAQFNQNATIANGKTLNCNGCVSSGDLGFSLPTQTNVSVVPLGGSLSSVVISGTVFIGPPHVVTMAAGQTLVATETANLGSTAGAIINPGICVDPGTGPFVVSGNFLDNINVPAGVRTLVTVGDTFSGTGTFSVGLCNATAGSGTLNNNDYAQGYAMVITTS